MLSSLFLPAMKQKSIYQTGKCFLIIIDDIALNELSQTYRYQ